MRFDLLHPADQLAMIMDRINFHGLTTTSGGNLSILDDSGDIWITPGGIDKGSLTRDDMVRIGPDGCIRQAQAFDRMAVPSINLRSRPDIRSVLHAHPAALVAFSIVRRLPDVRIIPNVNLVCGEITMAPYGLPGSAGLGEKIAGEFAKGFSSVVLENHGVVIGSSSLFQAFMAFETLNFCARLELNARRLGPVRSLTDRLIDISRQKNRASLEEFALQQHTSEERAARRDMIRLIRRSYRQHLFTSTQGTYSVRLPNGDILITPFGLDRQYLEAEDLVLIRCRRRESGHEPSRSVNLHLAIYDRHAAIHSILIAHPPHIMAFAVTETQFDSRTIPESYILLRQVVKVPFGASFLQPDLTAAQFSDQTPVVICENDGVIVTGGSLLQAFDRLEVAEFSAEAIIESSGLGPIIQISDQEAAALNQAFGLKD